MLSDQLLKSGLVQNIRRIRVRWIKNLVIIINDIDGMKFIFQGIRYKCVDIFFWDTKKHHTCYIFIWNEWIWNIYSGILCIRFWTRNNKRCFAGFQMIIIPFSIIKMVYIPSCFLSNNVIMKRTIYIYMESIYFWDNVE